MDYAQEQQQWFDRWQHGRIGFHISGVNPWLIRYADDVYAAETTATSRILVPLCGKTWDLLWLRSRFHEVIGVELVPQAVENFFAEHELTPAQDTVGPFQRFRHGNLTILQGDFFALEPPHLDHHPIEAVYDRASLIALPPELRERYVPHLEALLAPQAQILLIAIAYEEGKITGPPHSVAETEVHRLFDDKADISLLEAKNILPDSPNLQEQGASWASETAFRIQLR
jgi:thiopurine S-methyltransferase